MSESDQKKEATEAIGRSSMSLFRAHFETRHFDFEGYGSTEDEAVEVCYGGWLTHCATYNTATESIGNAIIDTSYVSRDDIAVYPIEIGKAYRDREDI